MSELNKKTVSSGKALAAEVDRRDNKRTQIVAAAEIVEMGSGARFSTRISDVSIGGCFVDALSPLPVGSRVHLTLLGGSTPFETPGFVVYTQHGLGMGVAFSEMNDEQRMAFETWLSSLNTKNEMPAATPVPNVRARQSTESNQLLVARLVHILVARGILTEEDGEALLREPIL